MTKPYKDIGNRLKKIRTDSGLNGNELSEILGIEPHTYRMYERGDRKVSTEIARKISSWASVSVEYIYYGINKDGLGEKLQDSFENAPPHIQQTIKDLLKLED